MWLQHYSFIKRFWDRYAEIYEESHGMALDPGEKRNLVLNIRIEDSYEKAIESARPGHDEFWKFLSPYGWSKGYMGPDGKPTAPGLIPTLEESMDQKVWAVGTPEQVAECIQFYKEFLGLADLTIFPSYPGDTYEKAEEQIQRFAQEVLPLLS
jgi:alkanesulfonate monooxygenase SsuD/methylene tetrahydromethanopterin reductase-like flavin-dependent oxidoreductase (luciferase family)